MRKFNIISSVNPEMPNAPVMLHTSQIFCDEHNFFADNQEEEAKRIESLAEEIIEIGFKSVIEVTPVNDKYRIVAGETRYRAMVKAFEDTKDPKFEYIPCFINDTASEDELRRRLIMDNLLQRVITPAQRLKAIEELEKTYVEAKKSGTKPPGRIQALIAGDMGMEKSQVGNYQTISKKASDELRSKFDNDEITVTAATKLSTLPHEEQKEFLEEFDEFDQKMVDTFVKQKKKKEPHIQESKHDEEYEQTEIYDYLDEEEEIDEDNENVKSIDLISDKDKDILQEICDQINMSIIYDLASVRTRINKLSNHTISAEIEVMLEEIQELSQRLQTYLH